jgi:type VI secretion system protein ImpA
MPAFEYFSDALLAPIPGGKPCGADLQYDLVFAEIREAKRADEVLNAGDWARRDGPKVANWEAVAELCLDALTTRTKDLRLAAFLAEAALHLDGFEGFAHGLRLCRELMVRYWDEGIYPLVEAGDHYDRAASLSPIATLLPDTIRQSPLTRRNGGDNYSLVHYKQAELVGSDAAYASASAPRRETVDALRRQGYVSMDAFNTAVKATSLEAFEELFQQIQSAEGELKALAKAADEKFGGDDAPAFTEARAAFEEIHNVLVPILNDKRPKPTPGNGLAPDEKGSPDGGPAVPLSGINFGLPADQSASWSEAETLVRQGQVDKGLAQMAALAASEGSQRARFLRKLMLVDVCLGVKRERLAKTILQELNQQITAYRLDQWESSALVGAVWSRLYKMYRASEFSSEQEIAGTLYTQLCQLDPWQAYLHCED